MSHRRKTALYAATFLTAVMPAASATAQQAQGTTEEILVTARRTEERLQDVPIALSAVSAETLSRLDIRDTTGIGNYTPSLYFPVLTNGYFAGRLQARPIIFRGLNLSTSFGVQAAGMVFLDGAPVVGAELGPGLDYERIEVLRGPQSVYFGRSTLSGAVNYVTKRIPDQISGDAEVNIGAYNTKNFRAGISTPIAGGLARVALTGSSDSHGGYYTNLSNPGERLGAQSTKSAALRVEAEPSDTVRLKGYVNYFHQNDEPAAQVSVPASADNCSLGGPTPTRCGPFPNYDQLGIYENTAVSPAAGGFIFGTDLTAPGRWEKHLGAQREGVVGHVIGSVDISDFATLNSLTAYEWDVSMGANTTILRANNPSDFYNHYVFSANFKAKNFSQEFRLTSAGKSRLRWTVGASFVNAESDQQFLVNNQVNGGPESFFNTGDMVEKGKSYGLYGGAYYDLIQDALTLSLEARYQWDDRTSIPAGAAPLNNTFRSFSPRVSLDYKIDPDLSAYVAFARGNRPGGFNARVVTYLNQPAVIAELVSFLGPVTLTFNEEQLYNYEAGLKGDMLDKRLRVNSDFYYGKLKNQQVTNSAFLQTIRNTLMVTNNVGQTTIYGVEFDGSFAATQNLTFNGNFSWNHSRIDRYLCTACVTFTGNTNVVGAPLPGAPQISWSAAADYRDALASTGWNWYGHADFFWRGKQHLTVYSPTTMAGHGELNLRGGIERAGLSLELYLTNATDNRGYTAFTVGQDYQANRFSLFNFTVADPRTFGGRVRYHF